MHDLTDLIDRYFAVWNETEADRRRFLIGETWSDDASYLDPMLAADGADGIQAMVAAVQQQFPAHRFQRTGEIENHHDRLRFSWELIGPQSAAPVVRGTDFGVLAPDGRLLAVTGLFDGPIGRDGAE